MEFCHSQAVVFPNLHDYVRCTNKLFHWQDSKMWLFQKNLVQMKMRNFICLESGFATCCLRPVWNPKQTDFDTILQLNRMKRYNVLCCLLMGKLSTWIVQKIGNYKKIKINKINDVILCQTYKVRKTLHWLYTTLSTNTHSHIIIPNRSLKGNYPNSQRNCGRNFFERTHLCMRSCASHSKRPKARVQTQVLLDARHQC